MFGRLVNVGGLGWWDSLAALAQVPSQGCSDACTVQTQNILARQPCEDQPSGDVWKEFWDGYLVDTTISNLLLLKAFMS